MTYYAPRGINEADWEYIVVALRFIYRATTNNESKKRAVELLDKLGKRP